MTSSRYNERESLLNLRTLCNELGEIEDKAYKIGIQLGVPRSKLIKFKQEDDLLPGCIDFWLKGNTEVPRTWAALVAVLESRYVSETGLAEKIKATYCHGDAEEACLGEASLVKSNEPAIIWSTNNTALSPEKSLFFKEEATKSDNKAAGMPQNKSSSSKCRDASPNDSITPLEIEPAILNVHEVSTAPLDPVSTRVPKKQYIDSETGMTASEVSVNINSTASKVNGKFPCSSIQNLTEEDQDELFIRLERDSKMIRQKYATLVTKTAKAIERSSNTVDNFRQFFAECSMNELASSIESQESVSNIMRQVSDSKGWSFFDYELLKCFIETFCEDEAVNNLLKSYITDFTEFCRNRLFEIPVEIFEAKLPHVHSKKKIVMKIDHEFLRNESNMKNLLTGEKELTDDELIITLNKIKSIQFQVSELLGIKHLVFLNAQKGCIQLTFRHFYDENPILSLNKLQKLSLALIGVKLISCDTKFYDLKSYFLPPAQASCPHEDVRKNLEDLSKLILDCQEGIKDPSITDWRKETLLKGKKLYEEYIQQCQYEIAEAETASLLQRQPDTTETGVEEVRRLLWSKYTATKFEVITATPLHKATESHDMETVRNIILQAEYSVNCTDTIGWTPLHYACATGNVDMVRMLVTVFKADTSIQDVDGRTALMIAALAGHDRVLHALLSEHHCSVETKDKKENTLITYACSSGNVNLVRSLICDYNSSPMITNKYNSTPLHIAAAFGREEAALLLINEFDCDTSVKNSNGWSLLHSACEGGNISLVRILIEKHYADVSARNNKGNTPLLIAAANGKEEVVLALINGFDCDTSVKNSDGWSLLHYACQDGNISLVRTLIEKHDVDIHARNNEESTPLHIAALNGKEEVCLALINDFKCNPYLTDKFGRSLLHCACRDSNVKIVQTLICDHKLDINARDSFNDTPLHEAALAGQEKIVLFFFNEFDCDVSMQGDNGNSLLHSACQGGNISLVRTLIKKYGADITARNSKGNTPLHLAAISGNEEVTSVLIHEFMCDANTKGEYNRSLLHFACQGSNVSLVITLINEHGFNVNAKDDEGNTPLHLAALHGREETVIALINEFESDRKLKGKNGWSLIQCACLSGNDSLIRTLIQKFPADFDESDIFPNMVIDNLLSAIMKEFATTIHSSLSTARQDDDVSLTKSMIQEYNSRVNEVFDQYKKLSPKQQFEKSETSLDRFLDTLYI